MAVNRVFTKQWENIITDLKTIPHGMMKPGNFYKVVVYKYADPKQTKVLAGLDTSYIFLIGRFTDKKVFFPSIKLKHVNPELFFNGIRTAFDNVSEESINESDEFRMLLRKFPNDGKPLFNMIKTKPTIYEGNYREYKMTSIKSVELVTIDKEYLRDKLLPGYNRSEKQAERRENLND
jgi:hypothetical protein